MSGQWSVNCRDASGRRRALAVHSEPALVTVTLPAGETAAFTPTEIGRLRAALRDAAVAATEQAEDAVWAQRGRRRTQG